MPDTDPGRPTWRDLLGRAQRRAEQQPDRAAVSHAAGIAWNEHRTPPRWHRCWAQSWGSCGPFPLLQRCPCGGIRIDGDWLYRNTRRLRTGKIGPTSGGENVGDDGIALLRDLRLALRKEPPAL